MSWQLIETAPKKHPKRDIEGPCILVGYWASETMFVQAIAYWHNAYQEWHSPSWGIFSVPATHWQPLPTPPAKELTND